MTRIGLAVVLLGIFASACSGTGPRELTELDLAEARWTAERPSNYEFELRISCFCPPDYLDWHRIRVVNDAITAVFNVTDQVAVPADRWHEWYTVDEIFDRIRQFINSEIFGRVEAEYHPALGFPQQANLIAHEGVADAGMLFQIRSFAAIE